MYGSHFEPSASELNPQKSVLELRTALHASVGDREGVVAAFISWRQLRGPATEAPRTGLVVDGTTARLSGQLVLEPGGECGDGSAAFGGEDVAVRVGGFGAAVA